LPDDAEKRKFAINTISNILKFQLNIDNVQQQSTKYNFSKKYLGKCFLLGLKFSNFLMSELQVWF